MNMWGGLLSFGDRLMGNSSLVKKRPIVRVVASLSKHARLGMKKWVRLFEFWE